MIETNKPKIHSISFDLANKCNLNCYGCNHLMPLVEKEDFWFLDKEYFKDMLTVLKSKIELKRLTLVGGEPLLHPELMELIRIARDIMPDVRIKIVTNGLNFDKYIPYKDELNNFNIHIRCSSYKVIPKEKLLYYKEIFKLFKSDELDVNHHANFFNVSYNLKGDGDYRYNYANCRDSHCTKIKNYGRLYRCPELMNINYLLKYFNKSIDLDLDEISIDIKSSTGEELIEFLSNPELATGCRFCDLYKRKRFDHTFSNKSIDEWVATE